MSISSEDFDDLSEAIRGTGDRLAAAIAGAPEPYRSILMLHLPVLVEHFVAKGRDYGLTYQDLGAKGQFAEMHRKVRKLRESVWDGRVLSFEGEAEITSDLFGNVLLMLDCLGRERPTLPL